MTDAEKTVFISYRRRVSRHLARAIYLDLRAHGYDVFLDASHSDTGAISDILLGQIAAHAHFVLIVSSGALDRCASAGDWLRMEMEEALRLKRNIVPVIEEGVTYEDEVRTHLPGDLGEAFLRIRGLPLSHDYFDAAMDRLRSRYLNVRAATPAPTWAAVAPPTLIADQRLNATDWEAEAAFQRALTRDKRDFQGRIDDCTQAIRLNPQHAKAYRERATNYGYLGDNSRAIADYNEAIRLIPDYAVAYKSRGVSYAVQGDHDRAIADYDEAIRLNPQFAEAYKSRGISSAHLGDHARAIHDHSQAIRLNPQYATAFRERGLSYYYQRQYRLAINDFERYLELGAVDADDVRGWIGECKRHL